jgi:nitric oxide reductase large subunit
VKKGTVVYRIQTIFESFDTVQRQVVDDPACRVQNSRSANFEYFLVNSSAWLVQAVFGYLGAQAIHQERAAGFAGVTV